MSSELSRFLCSTDRTSYYNHIHATYPILCTSPDRQWEKVAACPPRLVETFMDALFASTKSFALSTNIYEKACLERAMHNALTLKYDSSVYQNASVSQVVLQTLMLLVFATENNGRAKVGPPSVALLSAAVALAYQNKFHVYKPVDELSERDPDSDDNITKKLWVSLVIMDRWQAVGYAMPHLIPEEAVAFRPDLIQTLGEEVYHEARMYIGPVISFQADF